MSLPETLAALQTAIRDLSLQAPQNLDGDDAAGAASLLYFVRNMRQELQDIEGFVERETAHKMTGRELVWDGGRAVRRRTAMNVSWQNDDLARAVAREAAVDKTTGELPDADTYKVVSRVVEAICNTAAFGYWRKGQLSLIGIDWQEFCASEPGRYKVEVDLSSESAA